MRGLLYPGRVDLPASIGLLLLRLVVGAAFLFHGWQKIQNPFGWMGDALPGFLQALAALAEFGGGAALLLGLLTRLGALGIAMTMTVAASMVHISSGHPFVASKPGGPSWEMAAVYLVCSVLLLLKRPGLFSLDALLFGRRSEWPD
jgi:putative oxidoreductase